MLGSYLLSDSNETIIFRRDNNWGNLKHARLSEQVINDNTSYIHAKKQQIMKSTNSSNVNSYPRKWQRRYVSVRTVLHHCD